MSQARSLTGAMAEVRALARCIFKNETGCPMKIPQLIWWLSVVAVSGCAQMVPPAAAQVKPDEPVAVVEEGSDAGVSPVVLAERYPPQLLSEDILFDFLMGEIGLQRRRADVANGAYAELLKRSQDPRIARRATEIGLLTGNGRRAVEGAKAWSEADPSSMPARHMLVALLLKSSRYDEAIPVVEQVFERMPAHVPQIWLELHDLLIKQTDRDAMVDFAQRLAHRYPNVAEARFTVGALAWRVGRYELAEQEVAAAEGLRPDWELAALFHAQILQRNSMDRARDYLASYLQRFPKARDVRQSYSRLLAAARQYSAAREQLKVIVDAEPRNQEALLAYAGISLEMKEPQVALAALKSAAQLNPRDLSVVHFMTGQAYEDLGDVESAAGAYLAVTAGDRFLPAQARYVRLLVKQSRLEQAVAHLEAATATTTEQQAGLVQLQAQTLRDAKHYQRAYDILDRGLARFAGNNDLLYDRAMMAERLNRIDEAERDLREILRQRPEDSMVLNALGYTLADRTTRYQEALQLIEKALKLAPNDPFILDSMGWIKYRLGLLDDSLDYLNRAYAIKTDPEIAAHIGEVLWAMGRQGEARSIWQGSLKDNPGHETLMLVITRLDH